MLLPASRLCFGKQTRAASAPRPLLHGLAAKNPQVEWRAIPAEPLLRLLDRLSRAAFSLTPQTTYAMADDACS